MTEEILDLVDLNDVVIDRVKRTEVDKNPALIHREVGVILVDPSLQVLFQKRSLAKFTLPGYWSSGIAGHPQSGEDLLLSAQREMQEEIGFSVDLTFWKKELTRRPNETHFKYWFVGNYVGQEFSLDPNEVDMVRFLDQSSIDALVNQGELFYQPFINIVQEYWASNQRKD